MLIIIKVCLLKAFKKANKLLSLFVLEKMPWASFFVARDIKVSN